LTIQFVSSLINSYSSLSKLESVLAWIFRFLINCNQTREKRKLNNISINEICYSRQLLIKTVQQNHFANELSALRANKPLKSNSSLLSLSPFVNNDGLLRVGGRIQNSQAEFDTRHPILLPGNSRLTRLIFEREHRRLLHAGPQALLYAIRERYWPIKGRAMAKRIVHECMKCFRGNPKPLSQLMGQLPADRVTPKRPFFVTGIDFAGPITTLVNKGRGRRTNKSYIALFVCFSTKAIHLEAVSDLSSNSFITALRRFAGRRGYPNRIICDNATNFVGARNQLKEIIKFVREQSKDRREG